MPRRDQKRSDHRQQWCISIFYQTSSGESSSGGSFKSKIKK